MNELSDEQIVKEAKAVKAKLDEHCLIAEFVAPRLWEDPRTIDGGFGKPLLTRHNTTVVINSRFCRLNAIKKVLE